VCVVCFVGRWWAMVGVVLCLSCVVVCFGGHCCALLCVIWSLRETAMLHLLR
jgi:hypothetical protein